MPVDASSHAQLADAMRNAEHDGNTLSDAASPHDAPLIAHYAEGGFASVTPGSSVNYSGRQQNFVAQQHIQMVAGQCLNINAGKGISLFSHQGGMKHIARAGKLDIQAQQDSIGIAADRDVKISASQGEIVIAARKSLTLSCGGSYIKIADGKLELGCAGDFTVKAGKHRWDGPAQQQTELPFFPAAEHTNWLKLDLDGHQGAPMAGVPYTLHFADGQQKGGTLDGNGMAEERNLPNAVSKVVYHNSPSATDESRPTVDDLLTGLDPLLAQGASAEREPGNGRDR